MGRQFKYHVGELSEIASARRAGNELSRRLGFDEVRAGQVALVITEAATNIVKHAREGEILLRALAGDNRTGIEIIAVDRGPGMANVALRMEDGNSSAGTYGVGLGAIRRLSQVFDLYSAEGKGTAILMVVWNVDSACRPEPWQLGVVCLPVAGEDLSGDAWKIGSDAHRLTLCVADGLGHGPDAAHAADLAVDFAATGHGESPRSLLERAHGALHGTRGAALAVTVIDLDKMLLSFTGVGNIAGCLFQGPARRHLMSHNGIVGSNLRKVQQFEHGWTEDATVILHSDGIGTRWSLDSYPGLVFCHPGVIAAVLYRDFVRGRDDAIVVVLRQQQAPA